MFAAALAVNDAGSVEAWLKGYDAAFLSKDLNKIAAFYHPDVTIYEGADISNGWADYRDRHLGPELKAFENLEFAHTGTRVTVHSSQQMFKTMVSFGITETRRSLRLFPSRCVTVLRRRA